MRRSPKLLLSMMIFALLSGLLLPGCQANQASEPGHNHKMAALSEMPPEVQTAPETVSEAYRFAAANPEIIKQFPCYCGCGAMGHTSNYSCYVASEDRSGKLSFDSHALGCSICVDITQDLMRMLDQGKDIPTIQAYVDQAYSKFGPPTMP